MTVGELKKKLAKLKDDTRVFVSNGCDVHGNPNFITDYELIKVEGFEKEK